MDFNCRIDIAKDKHVAGAQDDRGFEFGKRLIFDNRIHGFEQLLDWTCKIQEENEETHVILGAHGGTLTPDFLSRLG